MKTKDFIKMLQDEDPSGEAHIRMSGGVPTWMTPAAVSVPVLTVF